MYLQRRLESFLKKLIRGLHIQYPKHVLRLTPFSYFIVFLKAIVRNFAHKLQAEACNNKDPFTNLIFNLN